MSTNFITFQEQKQRSVFIFLEPATVSAWDSGKSNHQKKYLPLQTAQVRLIKKLVAAAKQSFYEPYKTMIYKKLRTMMTWP